VDTSKQQQQPATKLCQSTKCKTENTVLRVLFSHLKITQNSDIEPPHAIEDKTKTTKFTQNCQETLQEHKDFWSFTKTAVLQAETDSTRERRCCGSNEDGTWDGTRDGTRDRTGPSKAEQEGQFFLGVRFLTVVFSGSFVNSIKGGLSLVQNLNSSAHWCLK
jgi:hypothetical protein